VERNLFYGFTGLLPCLPTKIPLCPHPSKPASAFPFYGHRLRYTHCRHQYLRYWYLADCTSIPDFFPQKTVTSCFICLYQHHIIGRKPLAQPSRNGDLYRNQAAKCYAPAHQHSIFWRYRIPMVSVAKYAWYRFNNHWYYTDTDIGNCISYPLLLVGETVRIRDHHPGILPYLLIFYPHHINHFPLRKNQQSPSFPCLYPFINRHKFLHPTVHR